MYLASIIKGFGARPLSFQWSRIQKPLEIEKIESKMFILLRFEDLTSLKGEHETPETLFLGFHLTPKNFLVPWGIGVVLSNETGQLDVILVTVWSPLFSDFTLHHPWFLKFDLEAVIR